MRIVMGLSGGMDSTTLLAYLLHQKHQMHCCIFNYGSTHNPYENKAALEIAAYYNVPFTMMNMESVMKEFQSSLLQVCNQTIPEGHYNDENMRKTVVPSRNLIFTSIMSGLAVSMNFQAIALGIHQGDHHIYPDCRTEFAKALDTAVYLATDREIEVLYPFIKKDKTDILRVGFSFSKPSLPVPYHLTRTCYQPQPVSCGRCGSCRERMEAFERIGRTDPIRYEERSTEIAST